MKKILVMICFLAAQHWVQAQGNIEYAADKLVKINQVFDNAYFVQFNVKYIYSTDTLYGKFDQYERDGNYLIKGNNFHYKLGDVEYMQNDSFAFMLFHSDQTMMLTPRKMNSAADVFPLRQIVDSFLNTYSNYYSIDIIPNEIDGEETITFNTDSANMPYSKFSFTYDKLNHYPTKIVFHYKEYQADHDNEEEDSTSQGHQELRNKTMTLLFSGMTMADTDFGIFRQENYIYFDYQRRRYIPIEKFKNYSFYISGIEQEGQDSEENPKVKNN